MPEGAWDGDEAMASPQALPEGSCTRTGWTGPSFVCGLSRPRSPHPCNGATLAEGTENVALRDLCLTLCKATRQNSKSTRTSTRTGAA